MTEGAILRDLDDLHSHGVSSVMIWAYYGLEIEYLSDTWFERVHFAVAAARQRGMRVWLMDEGSYPSGFAGGAFTRQYPDQRMKALVANRGVAAEGGKPVAEIRPTATEAQKQSADSGLSFKDLPSATAAFDKALAKITTG